MSWVDAGPVNAIPLKGARVLRMGERDIALFRTSEGRVYALRDSCPHRGGPLSQGIVHGTRVTCPLHDWVIDLSTGAVVGPDDGFTPCFVVRVTNGRVYVDAPTRTRPLPGNAPDKPVTDSP